MPRQGKQTATLVAVPIMCMNITCRENVAPLVLKLCRAKILSLRVMSGVEMPLGKLELEHLTMCLKLDRPVACNMQLATIVLLPSSHRCQESIKHSKLVLSCMLPLTN